MQYLLFRILQERRGAWKDAGNWLNYQQNTVLRLLKTIRMVS